jgi:hypothetical protein
VDAWEDTSTIMVGDRRMRVRRRRRRGIRPWLVIAVLVVLAAAGIGTTLWLRRPTGLDAVPGNAIAAAGAFQAKIGADGLITVSLEIRNISGERVTVTGARFVPPAGLTQVALTVLSPGKDYSNLAVLDGAFPPAAPVTLGTEGIDQNAIVAARFQVTCDALPSLSMPSGEQIFVTVRAGDDERQEELTPPVIAGAPWLVATARSACAEPHDDEPGLQTPLPPLPEITAH